MGSYKWVISPLIGVISIVTLLITPLITTHEPPSTVDTACLFKVMASSFVCHMFGEGR